MGIVLMRNSVVRNDNTRRLKVDEFRGFAISDLYAPLVFINSRDAKAAQIFTLAHELAHIWLGATGISNPDPRRRRATVGASLERTEKLLILADRLCKAFDEKRAQRATLETVNWMISSPRHFSLQRTSRGS